jgi:hypothetical protein
MNFRDDVLSVDDDGLIPRGAERCVKRGAILRDIDFIAAEHRVDAFAQAAFLGQIDQ